MMIKGDPKTGTAEKIVSMILGNQHDYLMAISFSFNGGNFVIGGQVDTNMSYRGTFWAMFDRNVDKKWDRYWDAPSKYDDNWAMVMAPDETEHVYLCGTISNWWNNSWDWTWTSSDKNGNKRWIYYWARGSTDHCQDIEVSPDNKVLFMIGRSYSNWRVYMTTARVSDGRAMLIRRIGHTNHHNEGFAV